MTIGTRKHVPRSIAVFGAAGRMGKALARHVRYKAPEVKLRLLTTSQQSLGALQEEFAGAECMQANFMDRASLDRAVKGMEGAFIVTPSIFDEEVGMQNIADALVATGQTAHVIRITGYEGESLARRMPESARAFGPEHHFTAKRILDASDLPVTYLDVGATLTDNFFLQAPMVREARRFIYPERLIPHIDSRDVGELAACLLLSPDERHINQFLTVNDGQDLIDTYEIVNLLSDVLKVKVVADTDPESFFKLLWPLFGPSWGEEGIRRILAYLEFEKSNSAFLSLNDYYCAA